MGVIGAGKLLFRRILWEFVGSNPCIRPNYTIVQSAIHGVQRADLYFERGSFVKAFWTSCSIPAFFVYVAGVLIEVENA